MGAKEGSGYVYFVLAPVVDRVKIGYSGSHPEGRLRELQTGCPVELFRLGFLRGTERDEALIHLDFSHLRARAEWFTYAGELQDFCKTLQFWPAPRGRPHRCRVEPVRISETLGDGARTMAYVPHRSPAKDHRLCSAGVYSSASRRRVQCTLKATESVAGMTWCFAHAHAVREWPEQFRSGLAPISPAYP